MLTSFIVPTSETAFAELVEAHEQGEHTHADEAIANLKKGLAHFVRTGIDLDQDL